MAFNMTGCPLDLVVRERSVIFTGCGKRVDKRVATGKASDLVRKRLFGRQQQMEASARC